MRMNIPWQARVSTLTITALTTCPCSSEKALAVTGNQGVNVAMDWWAEVVILRQQQLGIIFDAIASQFSNTHAHTLKSTCQNAHSHTRLLAHQDDADIDEPYNPSGHHLGSGGLGKRLDFSRVRFLIPLWICAGEGQPSSTATADGQQAKSLKCDE